MVVNFCIYIREKYFKFSNKEIFHSASVVFVYPSCDVRNILTAIAREKTLKRSLPNFVLILREFKWNVFVPLEIIGKTKVSLWF